MKKNNSKLKIINFIRKYCNFILVICIVFPFLIHSIKDIIQNGIFYTDMVIFPIFITILIALQTYISSTCNNRGILFIQIKESNNKHYLEISNDGGCPIYDVQLNISIVSNEVSEDHTNSIFSKLKNKKFNMKKNDSKYILLDSSIKKSEILKLEGNYTTKGGTIFIKESFSINDFDLGFSSIND